MEQTTESRRRIFVIVGISLVLLITALAAISRLWNPSVESSTSPGSCASETQGAQCNERSGSIPLYDSLQDVDPTLTDSYFLGLVFGDKNPDWKILNDEDAAIGNTAADGRPKKASVWTSLPLQKAPRARVLVLLRKSGVESCPGCGDSVDAYVIEKADTGWALVTSVPSLLNVSPLEDAEDQLEGVQLGPKHVGIQVTSSESQQGYAVRNLRIVSVVNNTPAVVFSLNYNEHEPTGFEVSQNSAYSPTWSYSSDITFEQGKSSEWVDLVVLTEGTFGTAELHPDDQLRWQSNLEKEADPPLRTEPNSMAEADKNREPIESLDEEIPNASDSSFRKDIKIFAVNYLRRFVFNGQKYIRAQ